MNRLAELLPLTNICIGVPAPDKAAALALVAGLFAAGGGIERERIAGALAAREELGSTGLGQGVAIPHGRMRGIKRASAALVRLRDPVDFDAPDGRKVALLVALLVPEHATQEHLEVLSELAQMLSDRELRDALLADATAAGVHARIAAWDRIRPAA